MPTILKVTYPTAQKEHICDFCGCKIQPGQKYVRQTNVYDRIVYDFVTHRECEEVAHKLRMYDDCDDEGLDGESFRENLKEYVYANHYDEHTDDVYTSWPLNGYEIAKKVLKELKKAEIIMDEKFVTLDTLKSLTEKGFSYYHFPTQSVAQKWLRETKNLHISIVRNVCGYGYDICKADNGTFIAAGIFDGPNDGGQWDTYEEALEAGIQEALKLIKV